MTLLKTGPTTRANRGLRYSGVPQRQLKSPPLAVAKSRPGINPIRQRGAFQTGGIVRHGERRLHPREAASQFAEHPDIL